MTDAQLIKAARKLTRSTDIKSALPVHYTLTDLYAASSAIHKLGVEFVEQHGERLQSLDDVLYRELSSWKHLAI